jgi:hypothetical protein
MDIGARPRVFLFVSTLAGGLCCSWFIYILCWCWCPEIRTSSIDWAQLSGLLPEDAERISLQNAVNTYT